MFTKIVPVPRVSFGAASVPTPTSPSERVDEPLMDRFVTTLQAHDGHMELKPGDSPLPLAGTAEQKPDGNITVHAEFNVAGKVEAVDADLQPDGTPVRLEIIQADGENEDHLAVLPEKDFRREFRRPHPFENMRRLLDNPATAVHIGIRILDRLIKTLLETGSCNRV